MNYPVYLDNNATTAVDPRVLEAMLPVFSTHFGNPASATHEYGWYAGELVQIGREQVALAIGASPEEIVFTSGATESSNLALQGVIEHARRNAPSIRPHVVTGSTEHRATLDTLKFLEARKDIELSVLPVDELGHFAFGSVEKALRRNTVLVSLMLANNEIGTLHPLAEIGSLTRARGILFHCDATQAFGKIPFNVEKLGADLLSLSAHKLYGPKGVGALFMKSNTAAGKVTPLTFGGGHEHGYRSGTLNVPGIVGFGMAAELVTNELSEIRELLRALSETFLGCLKNGNVRFALNGPILDERLPGNLNIYFPGVTTAKLLPALQGKISCSASSACSSAEGLRSHVLQALGYPDERIESSIRLGIGRFNTREEVESAGELLAATVGRFQEI